MQFTEFLVSSGTTPSSSPSSGGGDRAAAHHRDRSGIINKAWSIMPSMSTLLREIGLSVSVAFQVARPLLRAALLQHAVAVTREEISSSSGLRCLLPVCC